MPLYALALLGSCSAHSQGLFPPAFTSTPITTATEDAEYRYSIVVADPDLLDTVTITADELPDWLTLTDHGNRTATLVGIPSANDVGEHDVELRATDGTNHAEQGFRIGVAARPGDPPTARNDSYSTAESTQLNVNQSNGVLANDSSSDGDDDDLTAVLVDNVDHGTLTLSADGSFVYAPTPGFSGTDTFTYRARADGVESNVATVTITIAATNDPPVAANDAYSTDAGSTLSVSAANGVLANDTDDETGALTAVLTEDVGNGSLALNANGSFTYTPATGFNGTDRFRYRASDGTTPSNVATVTITVNAVNRAPVAAADQYQANGNTTLDVPAANGVLANDTDADNDTLTAALVDGASAGSVVLGANGSFAYTPPQGFAGTVTFTYRASDGTAQSNVATVTLTVQAANAPPAFTSSPPTSVDEGAAYRYDIAATDPNGDALTFAAPVLPAWLELVTPARLAGTPGRSDIGAHDVTVTVTDGVTPPVAQSFRITVRMVDSPPAVSAIPEQTGTEALPFTLALAQFVSDPDTPAGALTFAPSGALPVGLVLAADGTLSAQAFTAANVGAHTVRFTVRDAVTSVAGQFRLNVLAAGRADLALAIGATPNPVAIGTTATWTLTVTNNSPAVDVGGSTLDATFTGAFGFNSAPAGCALTPSGNMTLLACTLGALAGGAATSVTLTGSAAVAGDVFATATVTVLGGVPIDETPANDRATATLGIAQSLSGSAAQEIGGIDALAAAAADLDGDGFDDLALVTASNVLALMNGVDPANAAKRALAATPTVIATRGGADVAAADLDGDGDVDLAVATGAGAPSFVLRNDGEGFTVVPLAGSAEDSRAVAIADVDGNASADIVLANVGPETVYRNNGAGFTRTALARVDASSDLVLVNLGGDPLPELVIVNADGDTALYRNTGGTFELDATLQTGPATSAATGDFNGDGAADLVVGRSAAAGGAPSTLVLLNTAGGGRFFLADELGATATTDIAVADLDLDGNADLLAVSRDGGHRVYVGVGGGSGTFALLAEQIAHAGARRAVTGRLGIDERIDVALAGTRGVAVFYNDGSGKLGRGDVGAPTLALRGAPEVIVIVAEPYTDAGATAQDATDGDVTARIVTNNPVDTAVIGVYTVTYNVTDLSGNSAAPLTRTVRVQTREASGGGGGGAAGAVLVVLLAVAAGCRSRNPRGSASTRARGARHPAVLSLR